MGGRKAGDANVHTDRDQLDAIRGEAKRMGVKVTVLDPEFDVKGSWALERRPSLLAAVEGVERGQYAGIIVAYLSRLGRNTREQLDVWKRVEDAGGRIVCVRERLDTSTPAGRMTRTILAAVDERELEEHAERFEGLREGATAAGIWQRKQTPIGYAKDPHTRKLVPDERADLVREAFRERANGAAMVDLAAKLGMTASGVRQMLRNRVYLGELKVGRHVNPTAHPPLIDPELFALVQRAVATRPSRTQKHPRLLAGLVTCQSCGHRMAPTDKGYACHRRHSAGVCPRPAGITGYRIENWVANCAVRLLAAYQAKPAASDSGIDAARSELAEAEAELAAYLDGVQAAGLEPAAFANGARTRQEAIDAAADELGAVMARQPSTVDGDPVALWGKLDGTQRNRLLRSFFEAVVVAPVGRGRAVPPAERCRLIRLGAGIAPPYAGGGVALPIRELPFPALDDPDVVWVDLRE